MNAINLETSTNTIPIYGAGIGYRQELRSQLLLEKTRGEVDFVEIITENYLNHPARFRELEEICEVYPVIPHGVSLSIGTKVHHRLPFLSQVKTICELVKAPYYSEHLCVSQIAGIDLGHLTPLWFTEEMLTNVVKNVHIVQDYLQRPLILENTTYPFDIPKATMTQTEFFHRLVETTRCGVLLDVTNIFVNSINHNFDATQFLESMPLENVVQIHLAGGKWGRKGELIDSHSEPIQEESWSLLKKAHNLCNIKGVIVEQDKNFSNFELLLDEVRKIKHILSYKERQPS